MADLAELERRIAALENNRGASFRFVEVVGVDEKAGTARVKLSDGENLVSMPLRVVQGRTLKDKVQDLPEVGGQAACIFTGQGFEQGAVLGGVYSKSVPPPGKPPHVWFRIAEDGTEFEYDSQAHKLKIKGKCSIEVLAEKEMLLGSETVLTLMGGQGITLATPSLSVVGLGGGSGKATIKGDLNQEGSHELTGKVKAGGDIESGGKVIDSAGNTNHHSHP
jgi:phage baseplate assembly protein V